MQEKEIKKRITEKFTRNNFLIIVLAGILLLVIVWPVQEKNADMDAGSGTQSGQWDNGRGWQSEGDDYTGEFRRNNYRKG